MYSSRLYEEFFLWFFFVFTPNIYLQIYVICISNIVRNTCVAVGKKAKINGIERNPVKNDLDAHTSQFSPKYSIIKCIVLQKNFFFFFFLKNSYFKSFTFLITKELSQHFYF